MNNVFIIVFADSCAFHKNCEVAVWQAFNTPEKAENYIKESWPKYGSYDPKREVCIQAMSIK
jgi:hypothetical protein